MTQLPGKCLQFLTKQYYCLRIKNLLGWGCQGVEYLLLENEIAKCDRLTRDFLEVTMSSNMPSTQWCYLVGSRKLVAQFREPVTDLVSAKFEYYLSDRRPRRDKFASSLSDSTK